MKTSILYLILLSYFACSTATDPNIEDESIITNPSLQASVEEVTVKGEELNYTFSVTLKSPDTGCDQYANWWEIIDFEGELIYRRILGHSHVNEQPFTRSGGIVAIASDQEVYIRGHMNNTGYGSLVMQGSVESGFKKIELDSKFAEDIESKDPQPGTCPF